MRRKAKTEEKGGCGWWWVQSTLGAHAGARYASGGGERARGRENGRTSFKHEPRRCWALTALSRGYISIVTAWLLVEELVSCNGYSYAVIERCNYIDVITL